MFTRKQTRIFPTKHFHLHRKGGRKWRLLCPSCIKWLAGEWRNYLKHCKSKDSFGTEKLRIISRATFEQLGKNTVFFCFCCFCCVFFLKSRKVKKYFFFKQMIWAAFTNIFQRMFPPKRHLISKLRSIKSLWEWELVFHHYSKEPHGGNS